jgi:excisionase family DNA binding protein
MSTERTGGTGYLTPADVGTLLNLSRSAVYRKIHDGEIPSVQIGGPGSAVRVPADRLDAVLNNDRKVGAGAA